MSEINNPENELQRLREAIDRIDLVLVKLLNQRARYALQIGEAKSSLSLPLVAPERENAVLQSAAKHSRGPLDGGAMQRIFSGIVEESRNAQIALALSGSES